MASVARPLALSGLITSHTIGHLPRDRARQSRRSAGEVGERLFAKTVLCRFFSSKIGGCDRGAACQFAHGHRELRSKPDLKKTSVCKLWAKGRCPYDSKDCPWAHGEDQLQAILAHSEDSSPTSTCISSSASSGESYQGDDASLHMPSGDVTEGPFKANLGAVVFVPVHSEVLGNIGIPVHPSPLRQAQPQAPTKKQCLRCKDDCASPRSGRFCTTCGFMLVEVGLHYGSKDSQSTTSPWSTGRAESSASDGYDSDDDTFFERRDSRFATFFQSQQVEELAWSRGGLAAGAPLA